MQRLCPHPDPLQKKGEGRGEVTPFLRKQREGWAISRMWKRGDVWICESHFVALTINSWGIQKFKQFQIIIQTEE
jgi:hypothetical protein